jgi:hypothetical protein
MSPYLFQALLTWGVAIPKKTKKTQKKPKKTKKKQKKTKKNQKKTNANFEFLG